MQSDFVLIDDLLLLMDHFMQVTPVFSNVVQFLKSGIDKIVVYAGRKWRTYGSSNNHLIALTAIIVTFSAITLYRKRSLVARAVQNASIKDPQNSYVSFSSIHLQQQPVGQIPETLPNASIQKMQSNSLIDKINTPRAEKRTISPLVIDSLRLNLDEQFEVDLSIFEEIVRPFLPSKPFILRQAVEEVISKINEAIDVKAKNNPKASTQEKHNILLLIIRPWMKGGSNLFFYDQFCGVHSSSYFLNDEQSKQLWLFRILQALADKKYIQSFELANQGYLIQV
jgi:hypothetical protein